ncbi:MAG TPA: hypothetical protein DCP72_00920 [Ruminococcaceae bacterium]|nr:hypothetical protein [Oscillospiraceae bacterium]
MKTNFKRIGKQSISIVLAVMMMLSTMLVGMVTSNAANEATATVYTTLDSISEFSSYINSDGSLKSGYTLKANTQYGGSGDGANIWKQVDATKYTKKINGKTVYTADVGYYSDWGGLNTLQFQIYSGSTQEKSVAIINKTWTLIDTIKDKYWNGSSWSKPTWDSETSHTVTVNFSNATVNLGDTTLKSGTAVTVDNDKSYTLTVEPNSGYSLSKVMQGSTDLGTNGTYTLAAGTDDVTIDITTEKDHEFYVTGWMNGNLTTDDTRKFIKESDGIYTCTMTPTDNLYVTVTDTSTNKVYCPKGYEILEANTYSTKTIVTSGTSDADKWGILDQANKEIKITFDITAGISNGKIKWEYAVADPVSVELNADLVDDSAAYISSYTDNDTGNIVTNTDETVQSVNAKPGTSVTFKAKSVDGYFPKWKFEGKFSTGDTYTLDASSVTGTTVTVYLTYEKIENHNIIVASNKGGNVSYTYNGTAGTVAEGTTSSAISVASNSTITLKANAVKDYVFSGWEFDNESNVVFATGQDSFSTSITINVVGDVKVTATFEEHPGTLSDWKFMLSDSDKALSEDSAGKYKTNYPVYENNGTYSVTFPVSAISSNNTQFLSFSTDGKNSGLVPNNSIFTVKVDDHFKNYVKQAQNKEWGGKHFPLVQFQNTDDITNIEVTYNSSTQTYIINGTYFVAPANSHKVYATMGSQVGHKFGTTTISLLSGDKPLKTSVKDFYNLYVVNDKEQITVSCTVNKDAADLGYYVYAFVVNGEKVDVVDNGNNVYQTASPITVTKDLEITPIYYNKVIEADGNYITIYTNAPESLQTPWGNSISIYSWYNDTDINMDGAYPGQLMMRDSQGRFAAKVSKYAYTNVNGKFTCDKTKQVLGITNNNYYENEDVHKLFLNEVQLHNNQTYDYDDFEKLTSMGYDTVEFDVKYYADKTESNQKLLVNNATNNKPMAGTTIIDKTATDYEDLTNIDGELVSILGYTNETAKNNNNTGLNTAEPLQIISVGNQSMQIGTINNKWSTIWYVYNSAGDYVTQGMPSDFIPRGSVDEHGNFTEAAPSEQTEAYQAIVKAGLKYNSAKISYENRMGASTSVEPKNTGYRIDGRWYYARSTDKLDVNVGIIYRNSENDVWTVDKPSGDSKITGKVTGGSASFDYTDSVGSTHTNLASDSVERNTIITLNATNGTQYKFIGWATPKYGADGKVTGYTDLNLTDLNATYTVGTNTELYAMYEPYQPGSVTITHSKYTGADSHNGLGLFYVTAEQVDKQGNAIPTNSDTATPQSNVGSVELKITNRPDAYIKVTLTTQSYAKSHFLNFYYPEVASGVSTLKKEPNGDYYDKECPAENPATITYMVKVSDLFVNDKQTVMALNYYSDLKLPEVESNITFNYNPYNTAPNPNPVAGKGNGKTTFTLTITDSNNKVVYTSKSDISSLTLKGNAELKEILANLTNGSDYTITITMNPVADSHCNVGETYRQTNNAGTYTYTKATDDTVWEYNQENKSYSAKLSELFDTTSQKFKTNTINLYTDFTADVFNYNVTFKYLGYESREYYNNNGYSQSQIPAEKINENWWRTYTVSGTFYGTDIDKYFDYVEGQYKFKESFLLKVAPYEDNFVQSITWDLSNVDYSTTNAMLSVTATVPAKYDNGFVTVTADLGDDKPKQTYSVNYASLVTPKNLVGPTTQSSNDEDYLFVAPETNANGEKFSYWTIQTDDSNGIEVAKCYTREFNFLAYDNYLITACYGKNDVDASKLSVSATMQFLEYSRNQYDSGRDKVYADFAVSYNYNGKKLCADINNDVVCGVVFVVNSKHSSAADATDKFTVDESDLLAKVKALNSGNSSDKTMGDAKVYNYKLNKKNLDNKNRLEYSWNVNNTENNQNLTILAYSYIYNATTDEYSVSAPQEFKFFNVGNKTYEG